MNTFQRFETFKTLLLPVLFCRKLIMSVRAEAQQDRELLANIQDEGLRHYLEKLSEKVDQNHSDTNKRLDELFKLYDDINERLRAQERYSSKDSLIINNPPFDPRDEKNLLKNILEFITGTLKVRDVDRYSFKAYHLLPRPYLPDNLMLPIIIKFVYFNDKDRVFAARKLLKKVKNTINGKNIYINERLPSFDNQLQKDAEALNYITTTRNCIVSVLCEKADGTKLFIPIKSAEDLKALRNPVERPANLYGSAPETAAKRKCSVIKNDEEKMMMIFASMSPEQKKVFLEKAKADNENN